MSVSLCLAVVIFLVYIILRNFAQIKEYIRWRILLNKLPTAEGWLFLLGHLHSVYSLSKEDLFKAVRESFKVEPPLHVFYLGPVLAFATVYGADEIEAIISSIKNLEKAKIYDFLVDWLEDGLLTSTGNKWHTRRKILTPAFHFSILREFVDIFTRETASMVKEIEEKHLNKAVNVVPIISKFTLLTINETSMGTKLEMKTEEERSYIKAVYKLGDVIFNRFMTPWLHYQPIFDVSSPGKLAKRLVTVLHTFTNNIIRDRSKNFKTFGDPVNEGDKDVAQRRKYPLIDVLLNAKFKDNSINEKGIREEVNTFMFEGHDTTAMSLTFTCMLLALHKELQDELYQEIIQILGSDPAKEPTYVDFQNMTFLERCIKESLRLYPSVSLIGRKLDSDVPTKYGIVPRGTTCLIHLYELHRSPEHWKDPEKFDPSRHLPENSRGRHPFAYIPFSAGPRNCIGQRFAMLEMKAAICGIIRKFILEPVDTPESLLLIQDLVLRPRNGLKVKFVLRKY